DLRALEDRYIDNKPVEMKKEKKSFRGSVLYYISIAIIASIIGGLSSSYIGPSLHGRVLPSAQTREYKAEQVSINTSDDITAISAVAKKAMGSVVGITSVGVQRDFFSQREVEGIGSGVIVDSS